MRRKKKKKSEPLGVSAEQETRTADANSAEWRRALELCGDALRAGIDKPPAAHEPLRAQVAARSYTVKQAARRIDVKASTLNRAAEELMLDRFRDPKGTLRFPVQSFRATAADGDICEMIAGYERLTLRDLCMVLNIDRKTLNQRLPPAGREAEQVIWREVRGMWGLPQTYREYVGQLAGMRGEKEDVRRDRRRSKRAQRRKRRQKRTRLRKRLIDAFPKWRYSYREQQKIFLHIGEPNSGKTHESLQALKRAGSGWYLAPLRLLAYEIYDRLNGEGVPCSLLTGEEYIPVEGARLTAATIEMFNPLNSGECVVIDEAQMLADADRGWAWTRAMMEAAAPEMHIIGPPTAQNLIEVLASAAEIPYEIIEHQRLAPIKVADRHYTLESLPPHTILVAFTRRGVLDLKVKLERMGRRVSVVYGSLPPEVRRRQADRFADGETEICVATDAVGMGLNLPADVVCFFEIEKFDGKTVRLLLPSEVHQIGGRAGRYGLSKAGLIGSTSKQQLRIIRDLHRQSPATLNHARVAPTVDDLKLIPGNLAEQLTQWAALESIPEELRAVITTADLIERVELARMLSDSEIEKLGLASALQLVNAPTRKNTRAYWLDCAYMILEGYQIPLPQEAPTPIRNSGDLEATEWSIACADIYLWLSRRREFAQNCEAHQIVRRERGEWSLAIDAALMKRLDTAKRCSGCGRVLPARYRHRLCNRCYYG